MAFQILDTSTLVALQDAAGQEFAQALFKQIRADFGRLHDTALAQMRNFGRAGTPDFEATRRTVHELKGLSLTVGASPLATACSDAETLAQHKDTDGLRTALPEIIALCNRVRVELEQCTEGAE